MWQQRTYLGVFLLVLSTAIPGAAGTLDPQPVFEEFHPDPAVRLDGGALLAWTRQLELGGPWTAMAATLDPATDELGEIHEWGPGGTEQAVALASGYLAIRGHGIASEWFVQHLDASGQPAGEPLALGFILVASAYPTPDGGALVIAGGVGGTGGPVKAWKFDPDGDLLSGPTVLADSSNDAGAGVDAAGNVVVAWNVPRGSLFARRFSPDLQPLGPVLEVVRGGGAGIRVAVAPDGRFVVVFIHSSYRLHFRAYRANGTSLGMKRPFSVPAEYVMPGDLNLAVGKDERILVAWKTNDNAAGPVIRMRSLSFAGRPLTRIFRLARVDGTRGEELLRPSVESLPGGGFLIFWSRVNTERDIWTLQSRRVSGR